MRADVDGAISPSGGLEAKIIHTPEDAPDSICILVGDTVFPIDTSSMGKVGGTDFASESGLRLARCNDDVPVSRSLLAVDCLESQLQSLCLR